MYDALVPLGDPDENKRFEIFWIQTLLLSIVSYIVVLDYLLLHFDKIRSTYTNLDSD